ncbi:hypothetical protein GOEFS_062_00190 [Gordonia effusa NBRC 100432]|uniref:Knr4/Smi1-like domain-containing protein n=1 Tax=Gordonia effusa NBRC 100432 TaxID=1077974 RepID=H0R0V9_9ACTN|nr:hypothetical protein [Gordonia effusa]GAB18710.1 hypothetical protein GOEFS_062_00190 [Gordonia effusa NBRC 100432]
MSALSQLTDLVDPPPHGARPDWTAVAAHLGHTPPQDYIQIVETYGAGLFAGEVAVWVAGGAGGEDLIEAAPPAITELADSRDWINSNAISWIGPDGSNSPVDLGPSPLRYAAWGGGSSGAYGYWHQVGDDPNKWPVLYTDLSSLWLYHPAGIAAFLVDLLDGNYNTELIELSPDERPDFEAFGSD